jgi:HK97 family phage prohead protease
MPATVELRNMVGALEMAPVGPGGRALRGLAVPYGQPAPIVENGRRFREVFIPGAFADVAAQKPIMFQHGADTRVGRTPIGLWNRVYETHEGLRVEGELFNNQLVEPLADAVRAGAITGLSISFTTPPGGDSWTRDSAGELRTVSRARVREISIVDLPAYQGAGLGRTAAIRSEAGLARDAMLRAMGILPTERGRAPHGLTPEQRDRVLRLARVI